METEAFKKNTGTSKTSLRCESSKVKLKMKPRAGWCHGSDKSCCARLGDIVSWVWRKTYHQPYVPYRNLGIYESSALTMARWGADVLLSSIWVGKTVTFRNTEKIVLKIQSDTAISGQTEKSPDSNYGWLETLVSICDHFRKGLTASAPGFQHFLHSGGRAELRTRDILPRMLDNVIWYLGARCLSKASADMCD